MSGELPKILYCTFDGIPEPTGTSARAVERIRALEGRVNADGLVLKTTEHGHIERFHGMRLMRVPVGPGDLPARAQAFERAVRRQLESDEYQLVHFTDPFAGYALCELRPHYKFKLVYEVAGLPSVEVRYTHPHLEGDRRFMARLRRQELYCLMNADAVVVGSEQTARMAHGLGVSRERMTVIPALVDLSIYAKEVLPPPDRVPMRVVYLGGQQTWQGLSTLVFAASIAARTASLRLTIVGPQNPSVRQQLDEAIKHRKLAEMVEFLAPLAEEELPGLLAACDVGAAPLEKSERNTVQGAPVAKIAHYLAAGRPVVASDLPIVREICDEGCAALHKAGDEADMARRLVELAHDPPRRVAMGARARALALDRLSSDRGRTALLILYARLLPKGGAALLLPRARARVPAGETPTSLGSGALDQTPSGLPLRPEEATLTSDLGAQDVSPPRAAEGSMAPSARSRGFEDGHATNGVSRASPGAPGAAPMETSPKAVVGSAATASRIVSLGSVPVAASAPDSPGAPLSNASAPVVVQLPEPPTVSPGASALEVPAPAVQRRESTAASVPASPGAQISEATAPDSQRPARTAASPPVSPGTLMSKVTAPEIQRPKAIAAPLVSPGAAMSKPTAPPILRPVPAAASAPASPRALTPKVSAADVQRPAPPAAPLVSPGAPMPKPTTPPVLRPVSTVAAVPASPVAPISEAAAPEVQRLEPPTAAVSASPGALKPRESAAAVQRPAFTGASPGAPMFEATAPGGQRPKSTPAVIVSPSAPSKATMPPGLRPALVPISPVAPMSEATVPAVQRPAPASVPAFDTGRSDVSRRGPIEKGARDVDALAPVSPRVEAAAPKAPFAAREPLASSASELTKPPSAQQVQKYPGQGLTPASGVPPAEEWMGHLLFGYSPFGALPVRRGSGSIA